ncbi:MAG: DUF3168 domain-containing protein [Sphingobium sp.]
MNAESEIRAAVLALLRGDAELMARVNRIHDGAPVKATPPTLVLTECSSTDWGCKDRPGRDVRISMTIEDDLDAATRISGIMSLAEAAVERLASPIAGWRIGSLNLVRSRLLRTNAGRWNAVIQHRIRVLATM